MEKVLFTTFNSDDCSECGNLNCHFAQRLYHKNDTWTVSRQCANECDCSSYRIGQKRAHNADTCTVFPRCEFSRDSPNCNFAWTIYGTLRTRTVCPPCVFSCEFASCFLCGTLWGKHCKPARFDSPGFRVLIGGFSFVWSIFCIWDTVPRGWFSVWCTADKLLLWWSVLLVDGCFGCGKNHFYFLQFSCPTV